MRLLTEAQHAKLDKLPDEAQVVAWHNGPVVRLGDGPKSYVDRHGRLHLVPREVQLGRVHSCSRCDRGTWLDPNGMTWRCRYCRGTGLVRAA